MRFTCESCGAHYVISDEKVGPSGVKVRCKKCGNVIPVRRAVAAEVATVAAGGWEGGTAPAGADGDLDRELGQAFESVFGGGSAVAAAPQQTANVAVQLPVAPALAPAPIAHASTPAPAAEATIDWYVAIDDEQVGPLPAPGVRARWEAGEIGPDTLAWRPGMADWLPLSGIPEMKAYLGAARAGGATPTAPRAAPTPVPARNGALHGASNGVAHGAVHANGASGTNGAHVAWQPSAATALAALASEELSSLERPPPAGDAAAKARPGSLVERLELPEGGVDPTNLLPLPMKALEPTAEAALPPPVAPAPERTEIRQLKKSARRTGLALGLGVAAVVAVLLGGAAWFLFPPEAPRTASRRASPPAVAQAPATPAPAPARAAEPPPPPVAAAPAPAAPAASTGDATPPTPPAAAAAAATPATSEPAARAPSAAPTPPPAAAAPAPAAAPPGPSRPAVATSEPRPNHEPPLPRRTANPKRDAASRSRLAQRAPPAERPEPAARTAEAAPPAPAPQPAAAPRRSSDPLLDVGGDDDLEKELNGGKGKRSVYVPPAIGSDLPDGVSVSQINESVVGQKAALVRCIEQQKAADPNARGTLKLRWVIQGDGTTRDVKVVSEEFARQPIATCIGGVVKGIRFPRSRTAGQEVVFPFKF